MQTLRDLADDVHRAIRCLDLVNGEIYHTGSPDLMSLEPLLEDAMRKFNTWKRAKNDEKNPQTIKNLQESFQASVDYVNELEKTRHSEEA
jgi:hypothetical protein